MFRGSQWLCCLGLVLLAGSAQAQSTSRPPKEIGEIIQTALRATILDDAPPGTRPTGNMAGREIRLDYARTMAGFGLPTDADVRASLGLAHAEGSSALLDDCDQMGAGPCERLGRSVYAYVVPLSISDSEAKVQVHVVWSNRPSTRTYLAVWITEVMLTRSGSGPWKFLRFGRGTIS